MPYEISSLSYQVRVLCLEQDPADQLAMQDYGWILGWDVMICRDTDQCVRSAETNKFDLLVAGLQADRSPCALELLRTIRVEIASNAALPALLLSDQPVPDEAVKKAERLGDAVFRPKPLMLTDLKRVASRFVPQNVNPW